MSKNDISTIWLHFTLDQYPPTARAHIQARRESFQRQNQRLNGAFDIFREPIIGYDSLTEHRLLGTVITITTATTVHISNPNNIYTGYNVNDDGMFMKHVVKHHA